MPVITLIFWLASIASNGLAAILLFPKSKHFRIFWLFMVAGTARSLWLLSASGDRARYIWISSFTAPIIIAIEAAAVIHIFWAQTENYPNWRKAGSIFLCGIAVFGAFGAWLLRGVGVPADWSGTWQATYLLQRHWMAGLAVTMLAMRRLLASLSSPYLPIRPIAQRAAECLALSIVMHAAVAAAVMNAGTPTPDWARTLGPLAGIVNGALWCLWLPCATAECRPYSAPDAATAEEAAAVYAWGLTAVKARTSRMH